MLGAAGLQVRFGQAFCRFSSVLVAPQLMQIMHDPVVILVSACLATPGTDIFWFDSVRCTDLDMALNAGFVSIRIVSLHRKLTCKIRVRVWVRISRQYLQLE